LVAAMSASMFNESSWGSGASGGEDYYLQQFANAINAYDGSDPHTAYDMWTAHRTAWANDPIGPLGGYHDTDIDNDGDKDFEHPMFQSRVGNLTTPSGPRLGNASGATYWKALLWIGKTTYTVGSKTYYYERYWNDLNRIHKVLTQKYGFNDVNDIYIMFGNGTYKGSNTLTDGGKIDSSANEADMENAIKNWLAPKMNSSVQFFFWSSDHGNEGTRVLDRGGPPLGSYTFLLDYSFIHCMMIEPYNIPYVSLYTYNVILPNNRVYLNSYPLGTLTPTGAGIRGNDTFYFNDSLVPLYSDRDNVITFEWGQYPVPYEVSNVTIFTGGISTMTTPSPVGGIWIPVDKLSLLAPYITLVSTIILAVSASAAYIKYRKKQ